MMHSITKTNSNQKIKYVASNERSNSTLIPISANELQGFNRHMHPRNIFHYHKPNFKYLAQCYPNLLGPHIKKSHSDVTSLDFTNPLATSALTKAILLKMYGLDVELPELRLAPTVPQKLNYLYWIEDLLTLTIMPKLKSDLEKLNVINGLDIGTGCSCIYALLGHVLFGWSFIATETDSVAYEVAAKNLKTNNIDQSNIKIVKVESSNDSNSPDIFPPFKDLKPEGGIIEFTMCNPPFHLEGESDRRDYNGRRAGDFCETVYEGGGELAFFKRMFSQSQTDPWPKSVLIFTTMLGKKRNLDAALNLLKTFKSTSRPAFNFTSTELCQGKTMRWAIAWTFQPGVKLPPPYSVFDKKPYTQTLNFKCRTPDSHHMIESMYALLKDVANCLGITLETLELKPDALSIIFNVDARSCQSSSSCQSPGCQSIVTSHVTGSMKSGVMEHFVFSCGLKVEHVNQNLILTFDWLKGYNPMYMNRLLLVITDVITCSHPDLQPNDS